MKKWTIGFGLIAAIGFGFAFKYKSQNEVLSWKLEIFESEHRILRDELASLRSKPSYNDGVFHTIIRMKLDKEFESGMLTAFNSVPREQNDYVSGYHQSCEDNTSMSIYSHNMMKHALDDARKAAYIEGHKDAYHEISETVIGGQEHPDYTERVLLKDTLETVSPFTPVEND